MPASARDPEDLEPGRVGELAALLLGGPVEIGLEDQTAVVEDLLAAAIDQHAADRRLAGVRPGLGARPAVAAIPAHDPDAEQERLLFEVQAGVRFGLVQDDLDPDA